MPEEKTMEERVRMLEGVVFTLMECILSMTDAVEQNDRKILESHNNLVQKHNQLAQAVADGFMLTQSKFHQTELNFILLESLIIGQRGQQ